MARIAGIDLPRGKRIEVALTYLYGVGHTRAQRILEATGINPDLRTHELSDEVFVPRVNEPDSLGVTLTLIRHAARMRGNATTLSGTMTS